uniref:TPX2 C-terminal domain-containing protein n=1 Tax=Kalanchoe fedtschenkoi TaxID=63787 RepID=A0A7N0ZS52_KALFE
MEESTCLLHSFSLDLALSGTAARCASGQQRDPMHALGDSVSFGRFMTSSSDSSAWDRWSNSSHKRYVEEAAKYSQPGSVAQKKAFFEAYYKRKALLALENAQAIADTNNAQLHGSACVHDGVGVALDVPTDPVEQPRSQPEPDNRSAAQNSIPAAAESSVALVSISDSGDDAKQWASLADFTTGCVSKAIQAEPKSSPASTEVTEESEMDKPLLKDRNSNQEVCSNMKKPKLPPAPSLNPAAADNIWASAKIPCPPPKPLNHAKKENVTPANTRSATESLDRIKATPKPLIAYMSRTPARDVNRAATNSLKRGNDSMIQPLRTPTTAPKAKKLTVTPQSENRRDMTTPIQSAASGSRTTGPKWRFLGGLENKQRPSPLASSPFNFRTDERAAKRKEKLELKFIAKAPQKVQLQTKLKDKAESELKKLRETFCFRARPLPSFYKERKVEKRPELKSEVAPKTQRAGRINKQVQDGCKGCPPPPPRPSYPTRKNPISSSTKSSSSKTIPPPSK